MNLLEKLKNAAASGINWKPFTSTIREMCGHPGFEHSEFIVGQLLTAAVALFDDGKLTPDRRRKTWEGMCQTAFELVEIAHQEGRLTTQNESPPQ